ncbi:MAG: helix-turn-helix domain-containing protein, partial [Chitinophagaceae bacterium]
LQEVKNYLITSDIPVNEIAFIAGFEDTSSFGRLFKSKYAATPQQYRVKNRE